MTNLYESDVVNTQVQTYVITSNPNLLCENLEFTDDLQIMYHR